MKRAEEEKSVAMQIQMLIARRNDSPAIIASLYYASRVYSKYGGNAGRDVIRQDEEGEGEREGDEEERPNDETTPLLRDGAEEA